ALVEHEESVAGVGLVGARFGRWTGLTRRLRDDELRGLIDVDVIGGNQLPLLRVGAVRIVGPHDAALFYGFEELELGLRLRRAGFRLVVDGDAWLAVRRAQGRTGAARPPSTRRESPDRPYLSVRHQLGVAGRLGPWSAA